MSDRSCRWVVLVLAVILFTGCAGTTVRLPDDNTVGVAISLLPAKEKAEALTQLQKFKSQIPDVFTKPPLSILLKDYLDPLNRWEAMLGIASTNSLPTGFLAAGFLENGTATRNMNALSPNLSDADFTAMLKRHKAFGFNQVCFFLLNEGDGAPVPSTFYSDAWFGSIDGVKVAKSNARIQEAQAMGFHAQLWGRADDSKGIDKGTDAQISQAYIDMARLFDPDSWCVGLEIDEWGKHWWQVWFLHKPNTTLIAGAVDALQATGKKVYGHTSNDSKANASLMMQAGVDGWNLQYGFNKSPAHIEKATKAAIANTGGNMEIIASEFDKDSTTQAATDRANAAKRGGAIGTQTGRPR